MNFSPADQQVVNNQAESRFEVMLDAGVAMAQYREGRSRIAFIHTEVPREYSGRGLAARIVRVGLDYAQEKGLAVLPFCPYVRAFIKRHEEYQPLVDPGFKDPG